MKTYKPIESHQLSPRVTLRAGDQVRCTGYGSDQAPYRLAGRWRIVALYRAARGRIFADLQSTADSTGPAGRYLVMIHGPSYTRHGVRWRGYTVRRAR